MEEEERKASIINGDEIGYANLIMVKHEIHMAKNTILKRLNTSSVIHLKYE